MEITEDEIKSFEQIYIVACGSAWHVGMAAQYVLEDMADMGVPPISGIGPFCVLQAGSVHGVTPSIQSPSSVSFPSLSPGERTRK